MPLSGNNDLLSKILDGVLPSFVLNRVLEENPSLDKYDLASIFLEGVIAWIVKFFRFSGIGRVSGQ